MLDWLFSPQCAACGKPATTMCEDCAATLVPIGAACPRCGEPTGEDNEGDAGTCTRCRRFPLPLHAVVSPWRFGGQLAVAIRRLKLSRRIHIARDLAPLWAPLIAAAALAHDALIVPVPTHWKRRFTRGFDHTWLLATYACRAADLPRPSPVLVRARGTPPQRTMSAIDRRASLASAFVVPKPASVAGRAIILIDDVVTTGATLAAATDALLTAGATTVVGVALARATTPR